MRGQSAVKFIAVLLLIAALGYVVVNGFNLLWGIPPIKSAKESITYGLDLKGGVYIVYKTDKENPTEQEITTAKEIMRRRLDSQNLFDANVTADTTNGRLIVEIPNEKDPQKAVAYLGTTAKLTFNDPSGNVVCEGSDIAEAKYAYGPVSQNGPAVHHVQLKFTTDGAKKFADATTRLVGQNMSINLDGKMQSNPRINTAITGGEAIIEGYATRDEAKSIADLIQGGALPFGLKPIQVEYIGPTLGQTALDVSVMAGGIALALIIVFMVLYYRLPGVIASIALIAYTILMILIMMISKISLTLPGIAGIILSIGMAVDANVIIFERLKEELNNGKTLRAAIDAAFRRAFTAIFDANMTTILAGVVLWWLGTGPIQGFAIVLVIGVILSMFTALTLTRFMIKQFVDMDVVKNRWMYNAGFTGVKGGQKA